MKPSQSSVWNSPGLVLRAGATVLSAFAFCASLIDHQWIESLFEASPDGGSGETEWGLSSALLAVTAILFLLTRNKRKVLIDRAANAPLAKLDSNEIA